MKPEWLDSWLTTVLVIQSVKRLYTSLEISKYYYRQGLACRWHPWASLGPSAAPVIANVSPPPIPLFSLSLARSLSHTSRLKVSIHTLSLWEGKLLSLKASPPLSICVVSLFVSLFHSLNLLLSVCLSLSLSLMSVCLSLSLSLIHIYVCTYAYIYIPL